MNQAKAPTPTPEPVNNEIVHWAAPTNVDIIFVVGRRPVNVYEEPTIS